jgi:hypothetical protein
MPVQITHKLPKYCNIWNKKWLILCLLENDNKCSHSYIFVFCCIVKSQVTGLIKLFAILPSMVNASRTSGMYRHRHLGPQKIEKISHTTYNYWKYIYIYIYIFFFFFFFCSWHCEYDWMQINKWIIWINSSMVRQPTSGHGLFNSSPPDIPIPCPSAPSSYVQ